jgi:hypothetical protein
MKIQLDKLTNEYNSLEDNVKWNKMQMDKAEKDCYDINVKFKSAIAEYTKAEVISIKSGSTIKDKNETEAANTRMYAIKQKAREICESYGSLKDKYMKSVNELNSLKVKISDMNEKYKTANASIGGGGGDGGGSDDVPILGHAHTDGFGDAELLHGDAVDDVGAVHRALVVSDDDELAVGDEFVQHLEEAGDVRLVERGVQFV